MPTAAIEANHIRANSKGRATRHSQAVKEPSENHLDHHLATLHYGIHLRSLGHSNSGQRYRRKTTPLDVQHTREIPGKQARGQETANPGTQDSGAVSVPTFMTSGPLCGSLDDEFHPGLGANP